MGGQCRFQTQPSPGINGQMIGDAGSLSFGLSAGVSTSAVTLSPISTGLSMPDLTDVILLPSPVFQGAFRFESCFHRGHFLAFDPPRGCIMTRSIDQFSVVDFCIEGVQYSMQFQTLNEVLLPVVAKLGGDSKYVHLAAVCQDISVRNYFQQGMKCEWDYDDFAIYFHAHWETWDYRADQRSVRFRQKTDVDVGSKRQANTAEPSPVTKRSKPAVPRRPPTKVLVLSNVVGAGDVDSDLEEETADEAKKFGKLSKSAVKELSGVPDEEAVRIFLEFDALESAEKAFDYFNDRILGGRTVKAWYFDELQFKEGNLQS